MEKLASMIKPILILAGLFLFLFFGKPESGYSHYLDEFFDCGHLLLFGTISITILTLLNSGNKREDYSMASYFIAGGINLGLGYVTEYIQSFLPGREYSETGLFYDAVGTTVFLLNWAVIANKKLNKIVKGLIHAVSVIVVVFFFLPVITAFMDEQNMHRDFPMIGSFEKSFELTRWKARESRTSRTLSFASHGDYSLEINMSPGIYPGISTKYFSRDWRGFDALEFDFFLKNKTGMEITVRINDKDNRDEAYSKTFKINPGFNGIKAPLAEVINAPKGRKMNMSNLSMIIIFSYNLKERKQCIIDNIRLTKGGF